MGNGATLHYRCGDFSLHLRTKVDALEPAATERFSAWPSGVENIGVASTGVFWSGDELTHWRRKYVERRKSLQECGLRWARENVQAVRRTETGRFEQCLHRVANELVGEAARNGCTVIAFEDLTDIRDRMPYSPFPGGISRTGSSQIAATSSLTSTHILRSAVIRPYERQLGRAFDCD